MRTNEFTGKTHEQRGGACCAAGDRRQRPDDRLQEAERRIEVGRILRMSRVFALGGAPFYFPHAMVIANETRGRNHSRKIYVREFATRDDRVTARTELAFARLEFGSKWERRSMSTAH